MNRIFSEWRKLTNLSVSIRVHLWLFHHARAHQNLWHHESRRRGAAAALGADMIGLNFYAKSRHIDEATARSIVQALAPTVERCIVVNEPLLECSIRSIPHHRHGADALRLERITCLRHAPGSRVFVGDASSLTHITRISKDYRAVGDLHTPSSSMPKFPMFGAR